MPSAPALGGAKRAVELDATAFEARFNGPLVYESVRAELAARRRGTAATRTRGRVSGGGAKPWRQKGTVALAPDRRARRYGPVVAPSSGRTHVPTPSRSIARSTRGAAQRALAARRTRLARDPRRRLLQRALDAHSCGAARGMGPAARDARRRQRGRAGRCPVLPQHRPRLGPRGKQRRRCGRRWRCLAALLGGRPRRADGARGDCRTGENAEQAAPVEPVRATRPTKTEAAPTTATAAAPTEVATPAPKQRAAAKPKPAAAAKPKPAAAAKPKPAPAKAAPKPKPAPKSTRARKPTAES